MQSFEDEDVAELRAILQRLEKLDTKLLDTRRDEEAKQARDRIYWATVDLQRAIDFLND